jgi:hypothetical protein
MRTNQELNDERNLVFTLQHFFRHRMGTSHISVSTMDVPAVNAGTIARGGAVGTAQVIG